MDKRFNKRGNINNGVIKKEGEILQYKHMYFRIDAKKISFRIFVQQTVWKLPNKRNRW